jgi:hypothetical protein
MDATEYSRIFKTLLPEGPAWPQETGEVSAFDDVIRALTQEPARIDAAALLLLDNLIPDNANANLTAWERLVGAPDTNMTDAERLARIRGLIRASGEVSLAELEPAFQAMAGDTNVRLYNRYVPRMSVGSGAGSACGYSNFVWCCEYMPNILSAGPDDFGSWYSFNTVTNDDAQSPVTFEQTAATVTFSGSASQYLQSTADEDIVYFSVWVKATTNGLFSIQISGRDGGAPSTTPYDLPLGVWCKLSFEQSVASGGATPAVLLEGSSGDDYHLSWAVAGVRDYALEARLKALTQIHTRGLLGVYGESGDGEFEELLSHY